MPLDAPVGGARQRPVGSYRLMSRVPVPNGAWVPAEVKGNVRNGGLVVARVGDVIAWPVGRLRGVAPGEASTDGG
jgi:hypothetical protein